MNIRGRGDEDGINLRGLVLYTLLPELWDIFKKIIAISPMTETGFSLTGADAFLNGYPEVLQVTHSEFWKCMTYFLSRMNIKYNERRKLRAMENKGS